MKLTVSTTVDQQNGQDSYTAVQYSKVFDAGSETIWNLIIWASQVQRKHSINKYPSDWLADICDIRIGKVEE